MAADGALREAELDEQALPRNSGHTAIAPDGSSVALCERRRIRLWRWTSGAPRTLRELWAVPFPERLTSFDNERGFVETVFSPDGRLLAVRAADSAVRLWDVDTGKEVRRLAVHTAAVQSIKFTPDGRRLVSAAGDRTLRTWDVATGRELWRARTREGPPPTTAFGRVIFSADGQTLCTTDGDQERRWDVATGEEQEKFAPAPGRVNDFLAWSADGRVLATRGAPGAVRLWDVPAGKELHPPTGNPEECRHIVYAPGGELLLTLSAADCLDVWDAATYRHLWQARLWPGGVRTAGSWPPGVPVFSPDGRRLVVPTCDGALLLDAGTGKRVGNWKDEWARVRPLAFAPDGRHLASGGTHSVTLYDAATGKPLRRLEGSYGDTLGVAFSADGRQVFTYGSNFPRLIAQWDAVSGRRLRAWPDRERWGFTVPAFAGDGRTFAVAGNPRVLRARNG